MVCRNAHIGTAQTTLLFWGQNRSFPKAGFLQSRKYTAPFKRSIATCKDRLQDHISSAASRAVLPLSNYRAVVHSPTGSNATCRGDTEKVLFRIL
eukprot:1427301-Amphidinium_carterae.1